MILIGLAIGHAGTRSGRNLSRIRRINDLAIDINELAIKQLL